MSDLAPSSSRPSTEDSSITAASTSSSAATTASSAKSSSAATTNGKTHNAESEEAWTPISNMTDSAIREELERVREERDTFESQYRGLLSKLTQMRATLGDRLRQDAEELDRREQQIETLTSKLEDLESTVTTLKDELVSSHSDVDRLTTEVDSLRNSLAAKEEEVASLGFTSSTSGGRKSSTDTSARLEREREMQELLERMKLDSQSWETACLEERAKSEELERLIQEARSERDRAQASEQYQRERAEREAATSHELQAVLAEFQASQDSELQRTLGDYQAQIQDLTTSLETYKTRAESAESQLSQNEDLAKQAKSLTGEVKEKNLLIGKLRHEAVILNEHLTEALRRLRNDQSESNVDKRLVTNLLLQFIMTPRTDSKRFEMLNLIAGVLDWKDQEKEMAGLQKPVSSSSSSASTSLVPGANINNRRRSSTNQVSRAGGGGGGADTTSNVAGDESFSNLFVEFLLSEAERGTTHHSNGDANNASLRSPTTATTPTSPNIPKSLPPLSPTNLRFDRGATNGTTTGFNTRNSLDTNPSASANASVASSTVTSPSHNNNTTTAAAGGGGIGSYFGLSRGKK